MVMQRSGCHALLLAACSLSGCVVDDLHPRFQPAWEKFELNGDGWQQSKKVLLISDCQFHNLYSEPLPERNLSTKALVGTAIRPPQLDLFAADVVRWILREGSTGTDAIVHLGDALDLACIGELDAFLDVMQQTERPWVMAPGNHDFFYFGVYDPESPQNWDDACHGASAPLRKHQFIRLYVAALLAQQDPGFAALAQELGLAARRHEPRATLAEALPAEFEWEIPAGAPGFLRRIAWEIDLERPWRSYLLQQVDTSGDQDPATPSSTLILMDSCQYQRRPILMPNGWRTFPIALNCGSHGEMLPNQLRQLREWIVRDRAEQRLGAISIACHHPFDAFAPRTRSSVGWLWREYRLALLVTAHTHHGYFAHHDLGTGRDELELNIGSTTDWPMEWRTLQGFVNRQQQQIFMRSERFTLVDELRKREGYFLPGWEVPLDAPDDYRQYKQGVEAGGVFVDYALGHHFMPHWLPQPALGVGSAARDTERQVKDTLLWTYLRLLQMFPTDPTRGAALPPDGLHGDQAIAERIVATADPEVPLGQKVALLQQLERFERTRVSRDDDARMRFKLSQAAWASRFENSRGRRLSVEDELIRVEWEKSAMRASAPGHTPRR